MVVMRVMLMVMRIELMIGVALVRVVVVMMMMKMLVEVTLRLWYHKNSQLKYSWPKKSESFHFAMDIKENLPRHKQL
jgi:hypothetical protein